MMDDPRALLRRYELTPRKSLGQNFLVAPSKLAQIVDAADLDSQSVVLEVGAGLGTMTAELATTADRVIAVETDPALITVLQQELSGLDNVDIVHGDILELDPAQLLSIKPSVGSPLWGERVSHYCVVANLPYYITAAVLRHLMEASIRPHHMVVTVQREVAQRIVAKPGDMNLLAVGVQFYGEPRLLFRLKRGVFYPVPKVESAVLRIDLYDKPPFPVSDVRTYFQVVQAGFAQKRKQLHNTLSATLRLPSTQVREALTAAGLDATRRAQTLSLAEWSIVVEALKPLLHAPLSN